MPASLFHFYRGLRQPTEKDWQPFCVPKFQQEKKLRENERNWGKIANHITKFEEIKRRVTSLFSHGDDNIRITGTKIANGKIVASFHPDSEKAKEVVHVWKPPTAYCSGQTETECWILWPRNKEYINVAWKILAPCSLIGGSTARESINNLPKSK